MRQKDKREDFAHAYEVAAREARQAGKLNEAECLERQANQLRFHIEMYPNEQPRV